LLVAFCSAALSPVAAQDDSAPLGGVVDAKFIGDHILIPVTLQTEFYERQHYLVIDLAAEDAFAMSAVLRGTIRFGENEKTLKVIADRFRMEFDRRDIIPYPQDTPPADLLDMLTARYDIELGNINVLGVIGFPALRDFNIGIDPENARLTLTPSSAQDLSRAYASADLVIEGLRVAANSRVYAPIFHGDGELQSYMAIETAGYHTYIDQDYVNAAGHPAGDIEGLYFGRGPDLEISGMAAFYPKDIAELEADEAAAVVDYRNLVRQALADGQAIDFNMKLDQLEPFDRPVLLRAGLSLLTAYRFEINLRQGYMALTPFKDSNYSDGDFDFYSAAAADDYDGLRQYFADHPGDRNVEEAAGIMFDLGLAQEMPDSDQMAVVELGVTAVRDRRKSEYIFSFMEQLYNDEALTDLRSGLIISLGERAMQDIGRSQYPGIRQRIQMILGDRHLALGDAREGWKYFLSAAFNRDPDTEGEVRHELGRAYEALGRYRRAYSSYRRALSEFVNLPSQMRESAEAALVRLRVHLDPDDPLLAPAATMGTEMTNVE